MKSHGIPLSLTSGLSIHIKQTQIENYFEKRSGMGEIGETYLVGPDDLMRSDSFLSPETHSVKASFARPDLGSVDNGAERINKALAQLDQVTMQFFKFDTGSLLLAADEGR